MSETHNIMSDFYNYQPAPNEIGLFILDIMKWARARIHEYTHFKEEEFILQWACEKGHIQIAKWLLSENPEIDISVGNDYAFRASCENGRLDVAEWLCSLKPDRYHLETQTTDRHIVNWGIKPNPMTHSITTPTSLVRICVKNPLAVFVLLFVIIAWCGFIIIYIMV